MRHPFVFDADHLALDFLNTEGPVGVRDRLDSPEAIVSWLEAAGLLDPEQAALLHRSPPGMRLLLTEAHRLRASVLEAVEAWRGGRPVPGAALLVLNRALEALREGRRIETEGTAVRCVITVRPDGALASLAAVAVAAGELLCSADPARVRRCEAPDCRLWFLDTSRNGSRRWCSMARCGNRAKVAAHYRRRRRS